ncbi:MAG: POTRA domain-containing protein [Melioribacteraceae bacterium]|nr:POTRA domain-containing protein [Melioribacteraceae bacterium]
MKIAILILFLVQLLSAQVIDTLYLSSENQFVEVDSIAIEGNDITEEFIILREMSIVEGDRVNSNLINYDRERIYSLGLFNYVDLHHNPRWGSKCSCSLKFTKNGTYIRCRLYSSVKVN